VGWLTKFFMDKIYILSWGGGVNSTAMLAMIKLGMLPELNKDNCHIVFADTGAEMPYTYEHTSRCLQPMAKEGWTCKSISPVNYPELYSGRCQNTTLPAYCHEKQIIPSRIYKWCSREYKANPLKKYRIDICGKNFKENSVMLIGIALEEKHRAVEDGVEWTRYPLIEQDIDRKGCIELIKKAGLPIARKSGCFFCPNQGKAQWLELYTDFPELFKQSEEMERYAVEKSSYYLVRDIPLRQQINKWVKKIKENCKQDDFFETDRHCLCEL